MRIYLIVFGSLILFSCGGSESDSSSNSILASDDSRAISQNCVNPIPNLPLPDVVAPQLVEIPQQDPVSEVPPTTITGLDASIPYSDQTPLIDGFIDNDEWNDGAVFAVRKLLERNGVSATDGQNGGTLTAKHDGTYLYLKAFQPDNFQYLDSELYYEDDSIELFFDIGNDGASTYDLDDFQYIIRPAPFGVELGSVSAQIIMGSYSSNGMVIDSSVGRNAASYDYEIKILLSSISLVPGRIFGFEYQVNADENGGERDLKWGFVGPAWENTHWQDPSLFGDAILEVI